MDISLAKQDAQVEKAVVIIACLVDVIVYFELHVSCLCCRNSTPQEKIKSARMSLSLMPFCVLAANLISDKVKTTSPPR